MRNSLSGTSTTTRLRCATSTANGRKAEEVRNCSTDEGRPLGTGLQEQVPNHLRRLCPKDEVVNAEGKGLELPGQVPGKKRTARELPMKCRNVIDDVQNRSLVTTAGQASTIPAYGRSGIRHERWPALGMRQLNGTWEPELRCKQKSHKWAEPTRAKVRMRSSGADCPVVVMKRSNVRGAKRAGHSRHDPVGASPRIHVSARQN